MKSKRIITVIALCLAAALILCSCGSKTAVTKEEFISKAESLGCLTEDAGVNTGGVVSGTIAGEVDGSTLMWQAEFYELESADIAKSNFETNKEKFEKGNGTEKSVSIGNYATYEKNGDGKFRYLCRVDATLLYIDVDSNYKDKAKELIKALGY